MNVKFNVLRESSVGKNVKIYFEFIDNFANRKTESFENPLSEMTRKKMTDEQSQKAEAVKMMREKRAELELTRAQPNGVSVTSQSSWLVGGLWKVAGGVWEPGCRCSSQDGRRDTGGGVGVGREARRRLTVGARMRRDISQICQLCRKLSSARCLLAPEARSPAGGPSRRQVEFPRGRKLRGMICPGRGIEEADPRCEGGTGRSASAPHRGSHCGVRRSPRSPHPRSRLHSVPRTSAPRIECRA